MPGQTCAACSRNFSNPENKCNRWPLTIVFRVEPEVLPAARPVSLSNMTQERDAILRERLDRAGRIITKAAGISEEKASEIAAAPFMFARIQARIASEEQGSDAGIWMAFWSISKRAIPAMMIVAALSFGLSVYFTGNKNQPTAFSVDAYLGTNESGVENLFFAERRPLTQDEVLATIISSDRELGR